MRNPRATRAPTTATIGAGGPALAKITGNGWVRAGFVPPEEIRVLREFTRYRRRLIQARAAQASRTGKLLENGHVKVSSVISKLHGASGRDMMDAIAAGERDPKVLAQLARGRMRVKIPQLEEALDCTFFTPPLAQLLRMMLDTTDHLTAQIEELDTQIAVLCAPFEAEIARPGEAGGIGRRTAGDVIAEIGTDMTVFATSGHLVSWARLCPQVRESAGRRKGRNATGDGNACLSAAISEAVMGAPRTGSFISARCKRLIRRMPKKKALVAAGNSMLTIIWHLLADPGTTYQDLGGDYYQLRDPARQARNHIRGLERLGYHVTVNTINPDTGELTPRGLNPARATPGLFTDRPARRRRGRNVAALSRDPGWGAGRAGGWLTIYRPTVQSYCPNWPGNDSNGQPRSAPTISPGSVRVVCSSTRTLCGCRLPGPDRPRASVRRKPDLTLRGDPAACHRESRVSTVHRRQRGLSLWSAIVKAR